MQAKLGYHFVHAASCAATAGLGSDFFGRRRLFVERVHVQLFSDGDLVHCRLGAGLFGVHFRRRRVVPVPSARPVLRRQPGVYLVRDGV